MDISQDEPVEVQEGHFFGGSGATNGFASTSRDLPLGDYWLVIVNTSPWASTADIRLYLSDGAELVTTAQGITGGLLRETDFESEEPHAHVRVGATLLLNPQVQTHHLVDGRAFLDIEHNLFGLFRARGGDPNDVSYITPDGTEHDQRFVFTAREHGPWEFRVNEWSVAPRAGVGPNAYIALLWADVELPEGADPVEKIDTKLELTVEGQGQDMILQARLTELDSSAGIADRTIDFYSDDELIGSEQTDQDGVATTPVPPGHRGANRTYEAVFEGDDLYTGSSDQRPGQGGGQGDASEATSRAVLFL